jgi:hypothetical protein
MLTTRMAEILAGAPLECCCYVQTHAPEQGAFARNYFMLAWRNWLHTG